MRRRFFYLGWIGLVFCVLSACAQKPRAGDWQALPFDTLQLSAVVLDRAGVARSYPAVCDEGRTELERRLIKGLPGRLAPVRFLRPDEPVLSTASGTASLVVVITRCLVDSASGSGDSPTFFLDMDLDVRLREGATPHLHRQFTTHEVVYHPNLPTPYFEFSFADPAKAVLGLFYAGKMRQSP